MDSTLAGLVITLIIASGVVLMIYRVYLGFTESHEKSIETKQAAAVNQDLKQGEKDREQVNKDSTDLDAAIKRFEDDSK